MTPGTRLLQAGVFGAGLFLVVLTILGGTRADYDVVRHFVSILSLGAGGWVQILNFIVGGALIAGLGVGLGRRWRAGPGARSIPRLITLAGVGLLGCGVFLPDPSLGYPPGSPDVLVAPLTWHGALHYASGTAVLVTLTAAVLLTLRRGLALRSRGLTLVSLATALIVVAAWGATIVLAGSPPAELAGLLERIGVYVGWAWLVSIGVLELHAPATGASRPEPEPAPSVGLGT